VICPYTGTHCNTILGRRWHVPAEVHERGSSSSEKASKTTAVEFLNLSCYSNIGDQSADAFVYLLNFFHRE
jgi:hypothetical protein